MLKLITLLFLVLTPTRENREHNTKEAFFTIEKREDQIHVLAEFPWTVRKALLHYDPNLERAKEKEAFQKSFYNYVKRNFLLKNQKGKPLELVSVEEVSHQGHSHQSNFKFRFQGTQFIEVHNELLFNIAAKQKNYHTILIDGKSFEGITSANTPNFILK